MGARHSVARCPRWWSGAEDRSERIRQCVSEDRRSRAARSRGPHEIAVVGGADFVGWGWGAWAPKVRLHSELLISHLIDARVFDLVDLVRIRLPQPLQHAQGLHRLLLVDLAEREADVDQH